MNAPRQTPAHRLVLTLGTAGFLSGLIIVLVYEGTRERILANQAAALQKAVFEVLPGAVSMRPLWRQGETWFIAPEAGRAAGEKPAGADGSATGSETAGKPGVSTAGNAPPTAGAEEAPRGARAFAAYDASGQFVGFALEGEGSGFQDVIRLLYGFDPAGRKIVGMRILESRETPGLGDKIYKDPDFVDDFDALVVDPEVVLVKGGGSGKPNEVHAITGATISSRAVVDIVRQTQARWKDALPVPGRSEEASHGG